MLSNFFDVSSWWAFCLKGSSFVEWVVTIIVIVITSLYSSDKKNEYWECVWMEMSFITCKWRGFIWFYFIVRYHLAVLFLYLLVLVCTNFYWLVVSFVVRDIFIWWLLFSLFDFCRCPRTGCRCRPVKVSPRSWAFFLFFFFFLSIFWYRTARRVATVRQRHIYRFLRCYPPLFPYSGRSSFGCSSWYGLR